VTLVVSWAMAGSGLSSRFSPPWMTLIVAGLLSFVGETVR
jgi:hypothetical protein